MKKLVCILLLLCFTLSFAIAENIDLSNMTIEELALLRDRCQMEIMKSDKWQNVKVPVGVYQIGIEIPAGRWTITPIEGDTAMLIWGTKLDESGQGIDSWNTRFYNAQQITSPKDSYYKYNSVESITWDLKEGQYLIISDCSVYFSPYAGVDFGFK